MTRHQSIAYRLRWLLLIVGLTALAGGIAFLARIEPLEGDAGLAFTPAMIPGIGDDEPGYWWNFALYLGVFFITQWLFLCPRGSWRIQMHDTGRSMWASILTAAFIAMVLTTAGVATLMEIPNKWVWLYETESTFYCLWAAMGCVWLLWTVVFYLYWRGGDRYTRMTKMIRALIAGSIVELLVAAPVQAMVYDRDDCHCARGSYTGLVFGGTVLLWAFGPGIVLLFLREKYRREQITPTDQSDDCSSDSK